MAKIHELNESELIQICLDKSGEYLSAHHPKEHLINGLKRTAVVA